MEKYLKIINKSTFEFISINKKQNNFIQIQTGIGDLLLASLCMKNNLFIKKKLLFNINIYVNNPLNLNNPFNDFTFKIQLINKLFNNNEIYFCYLPKYDSIWNKQIKYIQDFDLIKNNLTLSIKNIKEPYIIFHTKCRFTGNFNYSILKNNLKNYFMKLKTGYKIYILGEKYMPTNTEANIHKITTIYEELILLKDNNNVVDLSKDNIYDNLNFNDFKKDLELIRNAEYNIGVGHGGHYCNSIIFGTKTIFYQISCLVSVLNKDTLDKFDKLSIFDYNEFERKIDNILT